MLFVIVQWPVTLGSKYLPENVDGYTWTFWQWNPSTTVYMAVGVCLHLAVITVTLAALHARSKEEKDAMFSLSLKSAAEIELHNWECCVMWRLIGRWRALWHSSSASAHSTRRLLTSPLSPCRTLTRCNDRFCFREVMQLEIVLNSLLEVWYACHWGYIAQCLVNLFLNYTLCPKKRPPFYFLNNSVKNVRAVDV